MLSNKPKLQSQEVSFWQGVTRIRNDLWHVLLETWTELGELMQEVETHNSPECLGYLKVLNSKIGGASGFSKV